MHRTVRPDGPAVLLTGFEPFGRWSRNSSALCVAEIERHHPAGVALTTRVYPVDFNLAREAVQRDLSAGFDYALLLGQLDSGSQIRLERVARNAADSRYGSHRLLPSGPAAIDSTMPLDAWNELLAAHGIRSVISDDAGGYVCNATYYWALNCVREMSLATEVAFVHVPPVEDEEGAHVDVSASVEAIELILRELAGQRQLA